MIKLNIANLLFDSKVSGPGNRDVIWLQGCAIQCKGCFNKHLWSYDPKHLIDIGSLSEKFKSRVNQIEGITILGGEPTEQAYALSYFLKDIQQHKLSTVVYTGHTYGYLKNLKDENVDRLFQYTDLLVDGPYIESKRTNDLIWRGSSNQRIYFLSNKYNESHLVSEGANEEHHISLDGNNKKIFKTGIPLNFEK